MDENKVTDTMDGESFFKGQPNILWIMADQHKATALSCLGEEALKKDLTPNLDSLAADGRAVWLALTQENISRFLFSRFMSSMMG